MRIRSSQFGSAPPFSRLDLISCRNLLIYLGQQLQETIIPLFHYALNYPGVLLLGRSENIRSFPDLFTIEDRRNKIFWRTAAPSRIPADFSAQGARHAESAQAGQQLARRSTDRPLDADLQRSTDRLLLARYSPVGVLVSEQFEIVQTRGDVSAYLTLPPGAVSLNAFRMAKGGLGPVLRDALQRAASEDVPVRIEAVRLQMPPPDQYATIEILPVRNLPSQQRFFLVLFVPEPADHPSFRPNGLQAPLHAPADDKDRELGQLRQDLSATRGYLQSLIAERDAKNQELISANEEIQSSNEELQSINEELETSKEELQSTNEELQTVNDELRLRNEELGQTSSDLANLLNNVTMPVLILGSDLRIRQFTPLCESLLNVRPADVGRSISEIRLNLKHHEFESLLLEVIETLTTKELEIQDRQGSWFLLRARPYRTLDNSVDGVVVVFIDIDVMRRIQEDLKQARDFAQTVLESVQVPLAVLDSELRIRTANGAFNQISPLPAGQVVLQSSFAAFAALAWQLEKIEPLLEDLLKKGAGEGEKFMLEHDFEHHGPRTLKLFAHHIRPDAAPGILIALEDITARKQAERTLRQEKEHLQGRVLVTEEALDNTTEELRRLTARLFSAQEEERRRVARDLHDGLGQDVAVLEMQVQEIEQSLPPEDCSVRAALSAVRQKTAELTEQLRRVSHELHPPILRDLGLPVALRRLAQEFETRERMPTRIRTAALPAHLPDPVATALFRITQEALHNIAKHAGDTPVEIILAGLDGHLQLTVADQGSGFETHGPLSHGLGLVSMQERVRSLGGVVAIESAPGQGTQITVKIPLAAEPAS
ncbi:MAG: PAS domain-containing protein [Acidobacteriota bacterium]|nr:PAS domain-containing protein [Acidobacteriota bacterium]